MATFNTVHVFGFGDVQFISTDKNKSVKANTLTKLEAFVNHIKTFKPEDVTATDYHVIHIFSGSDVKYLGKSENRTQKTSFSVKASDVNQTILNEFLDELAAAVNV